VVVILNIGGVIETAWKDKVDAILFKGNPDKKVEIP
jgi:hypothetical protein